MNRRTLLPATVAVLIAASACSSDGSTEAEEPSSTVSSAGADVDDDDDHDEDHDEDHGEIDGAEEVAEPPLHLLSIDESGSIGLLDLVDETSTDVGEVPPPSAAATDGRYVFVTTPDGLAVVDSGLWTWDHGDHFHYYRSTPAVVGVVPGSGAPTVSPGRTSTVGGTGVFFPDSGEAVLLDNDALHEGEPSELFRLDVGPHDGLVAPLGDGAVISVPGDSGRVTALRIVDAQGDAVEGSDETCLDPRGSITTAVGLVVGCADGALLWTEHDDQWTAERISYPKGSGAPRAVEFSAREGRPTVAALAGRSGIWLLDTRERTWDLIETGRRLDQVSASDDEDGHVLALDRTGRVRVFLAGTGKQVAVTEPLVATSGRRGPGAGVALVVDDQRAYLNVPREGTVLEIDYADGARVARELTLPTGARFFAEVGR